MPSKVDRQCQHFAQCHRLIARENKTGLCAACYRDARWTASSTATHSHLPPSAQVEADQARKRTADQIRSLQARYDEALRTIERQREAMGWLDRLREGVDSTYHITPQQSTGTSEATPIILASDWHSEELVRPAQVSGLNQFNPEVFERRATRFFTAALNLITNHINPGVHVSTVVLALLGDFITNDIHDAENAENNALLPVEAILNVQKQLIAGIELFLNHTAYTLVLPCKVGNHSRTTKKVRSASETGHSLETLMYAHMAAYFRTEPRVQFVMDDGYHTYLDIYDWKVRFHHGHAIQYQGGIGGLFIPAFKAISQWNKARPANLDLFGHFHQSKDGGNFLCNGSLIGYNSFALRIKADYEPPQQTLVLIDKKRHKTCTWPIYVDL